MNAKDLFDKLRTDQKLKKYLAILEDSHSKYPVFLDANKTVLSLPPIINSEATKITMETRNVFIDMTGTDLNKIKICLAILAGQFSSHCQGDDKFTIEPVDIIYEGDEHLNETTPSLDYREFRVDIESMNKTLGLHLNLEQIEHCIHKMGLEIKHEAGETAVVRVPPTRSDIMHQCDIAEDIGIAYGYNNITKVFPPTNTIGK